MNEHLGKIKTDRAEIEITMAVFILVYFEDFSPKHVVL
jgi:hypothetical protein